MKRHATIAARPRVVIVGGGFAGLETAFTLRQQLGDQVDLAVVAKEPEFLFKPNTINIAFGGDEDRLYIPLAKPLGRRRIRFHEGAVTEVNPERRSVDRPFHGRRAWQAMDLARHGMSRFLATGAGS